MSRARKTKVKSLAATNASIERKATSTERQEFAVNAQSWQHREAWLKSWEAHCCSYIDDMARCAYCGVVELGGKPNAWRYEDPMLDEVSQ
jgi:hypothetical protein